MAPNLAKRFGAALGPYTQVDCQGSVCFSHSLAVFGHKYSRCIFGCGIFVLFVQKSTCPNKPKHLIQYRISTSTVYSVMELMLCQVFLCLSRKVSIFPFFDPYRIYPNSTQWRSRPSPTPTLLILSLYTFLLSVYVYECSMYT